MHTLREPHMAKTSRDVEALTKESKSGINTKSCYAEKLKIERYEFGEVEALF